MLLLGDFFQAPRGAMRDQNLKLHSCFTDAMPAEVTQNVGCEPCALYSVFSHGGVRAHPRSGEGLRQWSAQPSHMHSTGKLEEKPC